jgi:GT2 family glycosyltransferase
MISIITAVHNQLPMNQLFLTYLQKHTHYPFELIIIDNSSTDGSSELFKTSNAKVIHSGGNFNYPYCQNLGISHAKHDWLVFLNNDVVVSPNWDLRALEVMQKNKVDIGSCVAPENMGEKWATFYYRKKWKWIKKLYLKDSNNQADLEQLIGFMFSDFNQFCEKRWKNKMYQTSEGFAGSSFILHRKTLSKVGLWDECIQSADFDLFLRTKMRSMEQRDMQPIQLLQGVYLHHFMGISSKHGFPRFTNAEQMISLEEKWGGKEKINQLLKDCGLHV